MTAQALREEAFRAYLDKDYTASKRLSTQSLKELLKEAALALVCRANAEIAQGEYEGAAADCTKAIEFDQNLWQAYYYLGFSSFHMEDPEAARQALLKGEECAAVAGVACKFEDLLSEIEAAEILITKVPGDNAPNNNADVEAGADVEVGDPTNQPWIPIYRKQLSATDAKKTVSLNRTLLDPLFDVPGREFPARDILPILVQIEDGEPAKLILRRRPNEYNVYWKNFIAASDQHELEQHRWVEFSYKWRVGSTVDSGSLIPSHSECLSRQMTHFHQCLDTFSICSVRFI